MIVLDGAAADILEIVRSSTADIDVSCHYVDTQTDTPKLAVATYNTAATASFLTGSGTGQFLIKSLYIANRHASATNQVKVNVKHTTSYNMYVVTLNPGDTLVYDDEGWFVLDTNGNMKSIAGSAATFYDTHANRPAASANNKGQFYFETDTLTMFRSDGTNWDDVGFVDPGICEGRLTLTTLVPVTTTDVSGVATLYFTPYKGNRIALYNGTIWKLYKFSEIAIGTGGSALITGLTAGTPYDVFIYDNAGTLTPEILIWTNGTTRATNLVLQDGVLVKSGATTRRYLGTFVPTAAATLEDSAANRYLWNYYNRVRRKMLVNDNNTPWTYSSSTWRQARASASNQLNFVIGWAEAFVEAYVQVGAAQSAQGSLGAVGIGVDVTNATNADVNMSFTPSASGLGIYQLSAKYESGSLIGKHFLAWVESDPSAAGTVTFYGSLSGNLAGFVGSVDA